MVPEGTATALLSEFHKDTVSNSNNMAISSEDEQTLLNDIQQYIEKPTMSIPELLTHVVNEALAIIPYSQNEQCSEFTIATALTTTVTRHQHVLLPSLASFIGYIIHRSHTRSSTVLGLLVFLQRLQGSLRDTAKDMPGASHRIFLATLIVASKALHDTSPKNKHWARYVKYFTLEDINSMERQILEILDYRLIISPKELIKVYHDFKLAALMSPRIQEGEKTKFASLQPLHAEFDGVSPTTTYQQTSYMRHQQQQQQQKQKEIVKQEELQQYRKGKFIIQKPFVSTMTTTSQQQQQQQQRQKIATSSAPATILPLLSGTAIKMDFENSFPSFLPVMISTYSANIDLNSSLSSSSLSSAISDETVNTLSDEELLIEGPNVYLPAGTLSQQNELFPAKELQCNYVASGHFDTLKHNYN